MTPQGKRILNSLRVQLNNEVERSEGVLKEFAEKVADDPIYQLEWAESAYNAAARRHVAQALLDYIQMFKDRKFGPKDITDSLDRMADSAVREALNRSTMQTACVMRAAVAKAWLDLWTHGRSGLRGKLYALADEW